METSESPEQQAQAPRCLLCPQPKPASWCNGCPRERDCHFVDARVTGPADVLIVTESPVIGRLVDIQRIHMPYNDDGGKLIQAAISDLKTRHSDLAMARVQKTYAVLCTSKDDPNKDTIDRCKGFLHGSITKATEDKNKTPVILAMGITAVRALGIKAAKLKDVQSRILPGVEINGVQYTVVVTMSTKMLVSMAGMYNIFVSDLTRAFQIAMTDGIPKTAPMDELTRNYIIPATTAEARDLCDLILGYSENNVPPENWAISTDTETNTLFPHRDTLKMLCVSFAWATGRAGAIPLWHPETPYDPQEVVEHVRRLLASKKPKSLHNAKFDLKVFMKYGWQLENFIWDTMLAEHALEEDKKGQYGLKEMTRINYPEFAAYADHLHEMLLKEEGDSQLENIRKKAKAAEDAKKETKKKKKGEDGGFEKIPLKDLLPYAAIDTDMTRRISLRQLARIKAEDTKVREARELLRRDRRARFPVPHLCQAASPTKHVVQTEAVPLVPTLARMEFGGIRVDHAYLANLQEKLGKVIVDAEQQLYAMAGKPDLKLNSAAAIANVLFSEGFIHPETGQRTFYPPVTFTAKGQMQTTEKVLKYLVAKNECPFSAKKLIYSKAYKAKNTFCANVGALSALDGFLHTNYNIHGTATRRLSSNDENMQNIPKELAGYSIKKIFIPSDPDSQVFVNCDAKNAEVRIFSAYSGDQALIQSINDGLDSHAYFASKIVEAVRLEPGAATVLESMGLDDSYPLTYEDFAARDEIGLTNKKYGKMLDKFRTAVKRVVFGILYGAGAAKIAETIGISKSQAQAIIDMLFVMFPSIPGYIEKTKWELHQMGFVETFFGVRRRFAVKGATGYLRSRAERQAVNFKIQSTSSSIVLACLIALENPLHRDIGGRLLLTVHDSIGFEWPKKYLSQLPDFVNYHLVEKTTAKYPWLPVKFKWDFELGPSYGECEKYDAYMNNIKKIEARNEANEAYTEEEVRLELASPDEAGSGGSAAA
jgi:DNA polymerase I-like protein with 3'-5' exonuclease and polymerase domains/uracil-DNA glycosylase